MTGQDIFNTAIDLISKRNANGTIDTGKTAIYKARSPGLISLWQNEIQLALAQELSLPISDLTQTITVNDRVSGPYYLAANLMLIEDPDSASFFQDKYEETKTIIMKRFKASITPFEDVYNIEWIND